LLVVLFLLTKQGFHLLQLLILLELLLLLLDQIIFQRREVGADLELDLLLGHVLKFFVLLVQGEALGVVDVS